MNEEEIASGSDDKTIKIWKKKENIFLFWKKDSNQFELVQTITGHSGIVYTLIKLNEEEIASGSRDKTIKIFSLYN